MNTTKPPISALILNTRIYRLRPFWLFIALLGHITVSLSATAMAQQTIAPPSLGDETKGVPAKVKRDANSSIQEQADSNADSQSADKATPAKNEQGSSLFDETTITESRRENGQLYRVELDHASGAKQYIEENDSDGKIQSTSNDIEETPNLPKWKLGSW